MREHALGGMFAKRTAELVDPIPSHARARHAGIDREMIGSQFVTLPGGGPGTNVRVCVQARAYAQSERVRQLRGKQRCEAEDPAAAPGVAQFSRLIERGDAEAPRGVGGCRRAIEGHAQRAANHHGTDAVGVRLDHHDQRHAGARLKLTHVVAHRVEIDIEPGATGEIHPPMVSSARRKPTADQPAMNVVALVFLRRPASSFEITTSTE